MRRLLRPAGFGLVVLALAVSGLMFRMTMAGAEDTMAVAGDGTSAFAVEVQPPTTVSPEQRNIPAYLAFADSFSVGSHPVLAEGSVSPGLYASSFIGSDCTYELYRDVKNGERLIGSDRLNEGRLLVTIDDLEPDRFSSTTGCIEWVPWQPLSEPLTTAYNGDYWAGDLAPGTWLVPDSCYWEEVVGFRGASMYDVIDSGRGPSTIEITDESWGFRIRLCASPMVLNDPAR